MNINNHLSGTSESEVIVNTLAYERDIEKLVNVLENNGVLVKTDDGRYRCMHDVLLDISKNCHLMKRTKIMCEEIICNSNQIDDQLTGIDLWVRKAQEIVDLINSLAREGEDLTEVVKALNGICDISF